MHLYFRGKPFALDELNVQQTDKNHVNQNK